MGHFKSMIRCLYGYTQKKLAEKTRSKYSHEIKYVLLLSHPQDFNCSSPPQATMSSVLPFIFLFLPANCWCFRRQDLRRVSGDKFNCDVVSQVVMYLRLLTYFMWRFSGGDVCVCRRSAVISFWAPRRFSGDISLLISLIWLKIRLMVNSYPLVL